jgi:hypothetical protein
VCEGGSPPEHGKEQWSVMRLRIEVLLEFEDHESQYRGSFTCAIASTLNLLPRGGDLLDVNRLFRRII